MSVLAGNVNERVVFGSCTALNARFDFVFLECSSLTLQSIPPELMGVFLGDKSGVNRSPGQEQTDDLQSWYSITGRTARALDNGILEIILANPLSPLCSAAPKWQQRSCTERERGRERLWQLAPALMLDEAFLWPSWFECESFGTLLRSPAKDADDANGCSFFGVGMFGDEERIGLQSMTCFLFCLGFFFSFFFSVRIMRFSLMPGCEIEFPRV